ncbi:MAG: hypothetical protein ABI843_13670 [Dokdonella sp.]
MSDRDGTMNSETGQGLAIALRALPQTAPQPDLWPDLAQALKQRQRPSRWRHVVPAALAAGVALALLLPRWPLERGAPPSPSASTNAVATPNATSAPASTPQPNDSAELDALHQRSQSLERWIAAFTANAPQDSRDLMAAVEVEDLIGLVDGQLDAARGDVDALPLWRRRVALLQDLATIRGNAFAVAANDVGATRASSQLLN